MTIKTVCNYSRIILSLQFLVAMACVALCISTAHASEEKSGFECQGYNTILHSNESTVIAVCHGQGEKYSSNNINQWQECIDSTVYIRDKKNDANSVFVDCSSVSYKELKISKGKLVVKHYYDPYLRDEYLPLVVERYDIESSQRSYAIVAELKKYTESDIEKTIEQMQAEIDKPFDGKTYFNVIYGGFEKIRAFATVNPDYSIKILSDFEARNVFDGEVAETLSIVTSDVELIEEAVKASQ